MYDVGQVWSDTSLRAQTRRELLSSEGANHPHRRFFSRPDFRQTSHFQPAWLEN